MDPAAAYHDSRAALAALADHERGEQMARYMRDQFVFFGVGSPERKRAAANATTAAQRARPNELLDFADLCWAAPERELQYVGADALRSGRAAFGPDDLDRLASLITTKSWWDTVDSLAPYPVGSIVQQHPDAAQVMDRWIDSDNTWVARSALLHQLHYKDRTDGDRLFDYSLRRAADTEFFIRKAIGWALRQYSKVEPETVATFVDEHAAEFSGLTVREARKHLTRIRR
ncbi:MAG: DNA alkylation repair protein [Actinomycetota bacterium]